MGTTSNRQDEMQELLQLHHHKMDVPNQELIAVKNDQQHQQQNFPMQMQMQQQFLTTMERQKIMC